MVTERIVRIPQADLERLRITCKGCGKVAELTIQEASGTFRGGHCPFCGDETWPPHSQGADPFVHLHSAWRVFEKLKDRLDVEFVLPADKAE